MRNVMIFAAVMAGLGTVMAQMADRVTPALARGTERSTAPDVEVAASYGHPLNIRAAARGHFEAEGRINGQPIDFMVDTGASTIALNETSAASFGARPLPGDYNVSVSTANGTVNVARTQIAV